MPVNFQPLKSFVEVKLHVLHVDKLTADFAVRSVKAGGESLKTL